MGLLGIVNLIAHTGWIWEAMLSNGMDLRSTVMLCYSAMPWDHQVTSLSFIIWILFKVLGRTNSNVLSTAFGLSLVLGKTELLSFIIASLEPQNAIRVSDNAICFEACVFASKDSTLLILPFYFIVTQNAVPTNMPLLGQPTRTPFTPLCQVKQACFGDDKLSCSWEKQWLVLSFTITEGATRMNTIRLSWIIWNHLSVGHM